MEALQLDKFRRWLLQSPPAGWVLSFVKDLLIGALQQGPIPRHIAFVMDGNRRFARDHRIETIEGHNLGFEALAKILEVCYKAGVQVVTVYAFSIENFKRSRYEVDALMDMAKLKISQMAQHGDLLDRYGACIRFLGNRDMLKPDVRDVIEQAEQATKHNTTAVFNVCCPYTSRDEITTAIRNTVADYMIPISSKTTRRPFSETSIVRNIRSRRLSTLSEESNPNKATSDAHPSSNSTGSDTDPASPRSRSSFSTSTVLTTPHTPDTPPTSTPHSPKLSAEHSPESSSPSYPDPESIDAATLTAHMFTAGMPPLDLLIRTSGVERLSDFMLWQCHEHTSIVFLNCLWPQFDLWKFLPVLVEWQWWRRKNGSEDMAQLHES